jgi:hypothetical protein
LVVGRDEIENARAWCTSKASDADQEIWRAGFAELLDEKLHHIAAAACV